MRKVLVAPATLVNVEGEFLRLLREAGFEIVYPRERRQLTEEDLLESLKGVSASLAGSEPYSRRVIEAIPTLRVIARAGVGFDAVDLPTANERGIAVTITPGANQESVAEHTFALILSLAKNLVNQHNAIKVGQWPRDASVPLRGRTLGIAGLGRIGKAVATRGIAFRMRILAYEPYPDQEFVKQHSITLVSLDRLLAESDILTLHVPLSAESKYLINQRSLALMKPSALLINTARGGLVCEADLFQALKAKRIAGAALDVFEKEPPGENALFGLDNIVLTAHTAGVDSQSRDDMALYAARAIVALSRGEWPAEQVVNQESRGKFRW